MKISSSNIIARLLISEKSFTNFPVKRISPQKCKESAMSLSHVWQDTAGFGDVLRASFKGSFVMVEDIKADCWTLH